LSAKISKVRVKEAAALMGEDFDPDGFEKNRARTAGKKLPGAVDACAIALPRPNPEILEAAN
jgi:hypothetical protein